MNLLRVSWLVLAAAVVSACGPRDDSGKPQSRAGEGREETSGIRNTENIGYAGNAIADKVDGALDAHDARKGELDQQLEAQEASP